MPPCELDVDAVTRAAKHPGIQAKILEFYAELDSAIARHSPTCWNRGACCHFKAFGHRLFVTPLELAWFLAGASEAPKVNHADGSCPYKADNRCTVRGARPMGCRVFYCQEGTEEWQPGLSEQFLTRLKVLHDEFSIPYAYCEWLDGLRQMTQFRRPDSWPWCFSTQSIGENTQHSGENEVRKHEETRSKTVPFSIQLNVI